MNIFMKVLFPTLLCSLIGGVPVLWASWVTDGTPLCTSAGSQFSPEIIPDFSGGAIVAWEDLRDGFSDIYAQHINAAGTVQWTANGLPICVAEGSQDNLGATSDGSGGAILTWRVQGSSDTDIYVQSISASGTVQWTADGVCPYVATGSQQYPQVISDDSGGAIVTWQDNRAGEADIYVQRISVSGTIQWATEGVPLCTAVGSQFNPQVTSDGSGGAIVTWHDRRTGPEGDIYAQRISASGTIQWTIDGAPLCTSPGYQSYPQITSDGSGGAIVMWGEYLSDYNTDIYVQRISASGTVQWATNGVPICVAPGTSEHPKVISDGSGGAIMTWGDFRASDGDIYAQRISASGTVQWTTDGTPLCTLPGNQAHPKATPDGSGGAILAWSDYRTGDFDLYVQRISASGEALWTSDGIPLCTVWGPLGAFLITSDGSGGAVMTWGDYRSGESDIYAQQIDGQGRAGRIEPAIHSVSDVPGDEGGWVNLTWDASPVDYHLGEITEYTVWRALVTPATQVELPGGAEVIYDPPETIKTVQTDQGAPILRPASLNGEMYYWELISSMAAYRLQGYSMISETLFDSTAVSSEYHYFQVIAHTSDPAVFWISEPDSGYSLDNLAPGAVTGLAGRQVYGPEGLQMTWAPNTEPDLSVYHVYRGTDPDFLPDASHLLAAVHDTTMIDPDWDMAFGLNYKVAAVDIHDNRGILALLSPGDVSGIEDSLPGAANFLAQNHPNPFNPSTTIDFSIERPGRVTLRVFDLGGRVVRTLLESRKYDEGRYKVSWDGIDNSGSFIASGVYFYRLESGGFSETKRMTLLR